jgi:hypothetical protein
VYRRRAGRRVPLRPREGTCARSLGLEGAVEPTVDATKHVNGGCRSLASDGKEWECYIGEAAVRQRVIGEGLLGDYAQTPSKLVSSRSSAARRIE